MTDAILFDLFGVIADNQSTADKHHLTAIAQAPADAFWDAYWRLRGPYDRGTVTGTEYWQQVATSLGTAFDDHQISNLIDADIASWDTVNDDMVALIEHQADLGTRLALLSNIPEDLAAYYDQHHNRWLRHFELVAYSCRIGHVKPEPAAFLWCCNTLGLSPDRIKFIDDRTENLAAARHLGMRTHQFTGLATAVRAIKAAI